jgi:hypothetical protein
VAAIRAASPLRETADSVDLVVISPMAIGEWDAATTRIRSAWPGRIRLVQVSAVGDSTAPQRIDVRGAIDDPVRAAAALYGAQATASARVVRGPLTATDSSWAREARHVLVWWPPFGDGLPRRAPEDSSGAVVTENAVLVAPFSRSANPPAGRVVARWADGRPAATEQALGAGCRRSVAVVLPSAGDVALRESTRGVLADLVAACGGAAQGQRAATALLDTLRGPARLTAARERDARGERRRSPLSTWLFGAAVVCLLAESAVRRRAGRPA